MLTTKEAAQRLGLKTTGAVRQLILAGRLKAEKRGRDWFVDEESVKEFQGRPRGRPRKAQTPDDTVPCDNAHRNMHTEK